MDGPQPPSTPTRPAYAGSTFSASPAPSSLPIPKLLSKSVPEHVAKGGLQARLQDEHLKDSPLPLRRDIPMEDGEAPRQDSPLDVFFRADRAEKARAQHAAQGMTSPARVHDPREHTHRSMTSPGMVSASRRVPAHSRRVTEHGVPDVFAFEMGPERINQGPNDSSGSPPGSGPAKPVRPNTAPSATPSDPQDDEEERRVRSQALKDLLFSRSGQFASAPPGPPGHTYDDDNNNNNMGSPVPELRSSQLSSPYSIGTASQTSPSTASTPSRPSPSNARRGGGARHRRDPSSPASAAKGPHHRPSYLRQEIKPVSAPVVVQHPSATATIHAPARPSPNRKGTPKRPPAAGIRGDEDGMPRQMTAQDSEAAIRNMEADLRRILNIGVVDGPGPGPNPPQGIVGS